MTRISDSTVLGLVYIVSYYYIIMEENKGDSWREMYLLMRVSSIFEDEDEDDKCFFDGHRAPEFEEGKEE